MTIRTRFSMPLLILALLGFSVFGSTASAAPPVAKDGRLHACYKAKGKGKGTLRLVRNGKVRCPRGWRKASWQANGFLGPGTPSVPAGPKGEPGPRGEQGVPGTAGNVVVKELEDKVSELLTKVQQLEGVLAGVTNADLLGAIAAVPAVGALCEQTEGLTGRVNSLITSVGGLNSLLDTLLVLFDPVGLPTALPTFTCPTS